MNVVKMLDVRRKMEDVDLFLSVLSYIYAIIKSHELRDTYGSRFIVHG